MPLFFSQTREAVQAPIWHLERTLGTSWDTMGAAGRPQGGLKSEFNCSRDEFGNPFQKMFGARDLKLFF